MEIQSKLFGHQVVDSDTIITFPNGIPGFEHNREYKLFHQQGNHTIYWLQAVDDEDLAFSVSYPSYFNINYQFTLTAEEETTLALENIEDLIFLIMLHQDANNPTAQRPTVKGSIKSPLIINAKTRKGIQKQLHNVEQSIVLTESNSEIDMVEKLQGVI